MCQLVSNSASRICLDWVSKIILVQQILISVSIMHCSNIEDKTLAEYAVNYALFFMLKFDAAIHQITEVDYIVLPMKSIIL